MFHEFYELPQAPGYDGEFHTDETLDGLEEEQSALALLRRCSHLVQPLMRRHGWRCFTLGELQPINNYSNREGYTAAGLTSYTDYKSFKIQVALRSEDNKSFLYPERIMAVMVHELGHLRYYHHGPSLHILHWGLRREYQQLQTKASL